MFRPVSDKETVKRKNTVQQTKYSVEGYPKETNTILGWVIKTHIFITFLSTDKAQKRIQDIEDFLQQEFVSTKEI